MSVCALRDSGYGHVYSCDEFIDLCLWYCQSFHHRFSLLGRDYLFFSLAFMKAILYGLHHVYAKAVYTRVSFLPVMTENEVFSFHEKL